MINNDSSIDSGEGQGQDRQDPAPSPKEERADQIIKLHAQGMGKKSIAKKFGIDVKTVRAILKTAGADQIQTPPAGSKLDRFREAIRERVDKGMSATVIFREIHAQGYDGGITILRDFIRTIRGPVKRKVKAFRRFETAPGQEAQVDWSTFRVTIAGVECVVQCFAMVLAWSRFVFVQFHRDQKLPSLLAAHVAAFKAMGGVASRVVYDNMATITLGRRGREPIWNPRFLEFARHWLFEPFLCRPGDPNRKGKIERLFEYIASSLLTGHMFASWAEFDAATERWQTEVANCRVHGTTRAVPAELWVQERELLTPPPETPFPTYREEMRTVQRDCTISVGGHLYSVPADLVRCTVCVRVHPRHIEVFDARAILRAQHAIPDRPGVAAIDRSHYASIRRQPVANAGEVERAFLTAFPGCEAFLDGLKLRMKALWRIHVGKIERLLPVYGLDHLRAAIDKATVYHNFNANAVERILVRAHPLLAVEAESMPQPLHAHPEILAEDGDTGSLTDYRDVATTEQKPEVESSPTSDNDKEDEDGTQGMLFPITQ